MGAANSHSASVGPVRVVGSSYYSQSTSQLVAVLEVETSLKLETLGVEAVYVGPNGQQVSSTGSISPNTLHAGAKGLLVFAFPAAQAGGRVVVEFWDGDVGFYEVSVRV